MVGNEVVSGRDWNVERGVRGGNKGRGGKELTFSAPPKVASKVGV